MREKSCLKKKKKQKQWQTHLEWGKEPATTGWMLMSDDEIFVFNGGQLMFISELTAFNNRCRTACGRQPNFPERQHYIQKTSVQPAIIST